MTANNLEGRCILILEDEYFLADDLREELLDCGAVVLGPASSVRSAEDIISQCRVDAAVLDINLQGELAFPLADKLKAEGVPFAFATGYAGEAIPDRFSDTPRLEKPLKASQTSELLGRLLLSEHNQG